MDRKRLPYPQLKCLSLLLLIVSYAWLFYDKGITTSCLTWLLALVVFYLYQKTALFSVCRKTLAYLVFFITPVLSMTGQISVLTGFGGTGASTPWLGISFVTSALAIQIFTNSLRFTNLWSSIMQPIRMSSGPVALSNTFVSKLSIAKAKVYLSWTILGVFFYSVLASNLEQFLILKASSESLDILVFSIVFEFYVYFNFCGISFIVYGLLGLCGVRAVVNFNMPFAAPNLINYWQRWHLSLSAVLKHLFFNPIRAHGGGSLAVIVVFFASAVWHGVSFNFVLWGAFHAIGWQMTYWLTRCIPSIKISRVINFCIFPFFVIVGRLIFSEFDTAILLRKLDHLLLHFTINRDDMVSHFDLDVQTTALLCLSVCYIAVEILSRNIKGIKFIRYKLMRQIWLWPLWIGLSIAFGYSGLGAVYGSR